MPTPAEDTIVGKTANTGEWAEIYVFLMLLGEGRLYAADELLRKKSDSYVEVLKILREEIAGMVTEYVRHSDECGEATIEVVQEGREPISVGAWEFVENGLHFFEYLSSRRTVGAGSVPATDELYSFCERIRVTKPKSPSVRSAGDFGGKTDIVINLRDCRSALVSTMGFSIKSQFASPPTLYNAGSSTQFLYEIEGASLEGIERFNALADSRNWTDAASLYSELGWNARFLRTQNPVTTQNLFCIRDSMVDIVAWLFKRALLEDYNRSKDLRELCAEMEAANPLGFPRTDVYEKSIKDFLFAAFAGMTGGRPWDGTEQINGGYIVVKPDGDVLCYHANDRENFRNYLLNSTHLEYVSRHKYKWGTIAQDEDGRFIIPLNCSVRFKSMPKSVFENG